MSEIHDVLEALGVEVVSESGEELQAHCPMHRERTGKDDRNPSWWINSDSGKSICFSCGYSASLETLVADVRGMRTASGFADYDAVEEWLKNYRDSLEVAVRKLNRREWLGERPKVIEMTDARLAVFTEPPQWALEARNLTAESCRKYGIVWDDKEQSWITPLREAHTNKLLGWQMKGQGHKLFRNRPAGMVKSSTLFGYDAFTGGQMVVVEAPLDCARLAAAGVDGAVATCGAKISDQQIQLIKSADRIIFAMDNPQIDEAGEQALKQFHGASLRQGFDFLQFAYGETGAKDPGDMTDDQIHTGIANAKHSIFGVEAMTNA